MLVSLVVELEWMFAEMIPSAVLLLIPPGYSVLSLVGFEVQCLHAVSATAVKTEYSQVSAFLVGDVVVLRMQHGYQSSVEQFYISFTHLVITLLSSDLIPSGTAANDYEGPLLQSIASASVGSIGPIPPPLCM